MVRPLITKPHDVKYEILSYSEARAKLQADLDGYIDSESIGTGNYHAVALEFSLPSGSYATIALREITRLLFFAVYGVVFIHFCLENPANTSPRNFRWSLMSITVLCGVQ